MRLKLSTMSPRAVKGVHETGRLLAMSKYSTTPCALIVGCVALVLLEAISGYMFSVGVDIFARRTLSFCSAYSLEAHI